MSKVFEYLNGKRKRVSDRDAKILTVLKKGRVVSAEEKKVDDKKPAPKRKKVSARAATERYKRRDMRAED